MRILLFEDSDPIAKWITLLLEPLGHQVSRYNCGTNGIEAARQVPPDLVIAEYMLPDIRGEDLLSELAELGVIGKTIVIYPAGTALDVKHDAQHLFRPFQRQELLEAVAGGLRGQPVAAEAAGSVAQPMHGTLALILAQLFQQRSTGVLTISRETIQRKVTIRGGAPTTVAGGYESDNFGRFLVRRGVVDESVLEQSHTVMVSQGLPQGEALVTVGALTYARLFQWLQAFHRDRLLAMFAWPDCQFHFDPNAVIPAGETIYQMDPTSVIFEGFQRLSQVEPLYQWQETNGESYGIRCDRFVDLYPSIHALAPKLPLLELTDGLETINQKLKSPGLDLIFGLRALCAMEVLGMMEVAPQASAAIELEISIDGDVIVGEYGLDPHYEDLDIDIEDSGALEEIFRTYLSMQFKDYYSLLQVDRELTQGEIDQAYEVERKRFEGALSEVVELPDAVAKAREILVHLQFAHSVLADTEARAAYDKQLRKGESYWLERRISLGAEQRFKSGLAALRAGKHQVARIEFEAARALRPEDSLIAMHAAWATYLGIQENAKQIALLRNTLYESAQLLGHAEGYAFLAQVCADIGSPHEAKQLSEYALSLDSASLLARTVLDQVTVNTKQ